MFGGATPEAAPTTRAATDATTASSSSGEVAGAFPIEAFADISEDPVTDQMAAELQAILDDMAGDGGMTATVMTPDGTWSGASGTADGVRDMQVDDQFFIARWHRTARHTAHTIGREVPGVRGLTFCVRIQHEH